MEIAAGQKSVQDRSDDNLAKQLGLSIPTLLLVGGFSLLYFADVLLRASEKYWWYDEIFTIYACRLPTLNALWDALSHGFEFNPPLFYILTNASQSVFGEGLISSRLPQIIAFWILCLSLFRFVNRRSGAMAGLIAMTLPMLTTAYFYAYEARPYGIILGFTGLALVCWQMSIEQPRSRLWLVSFSGFLLGALLLHCYALLVVVPFAVAEVFRTIRSRRINWPMFVALTIPTVIAASTYVPLVIAYKSLAGGTDFEAGGRAGWAHFVYFYVFLLAPCVLLATFALALLVVNRAKKFLGFVAPAPVRGAEHTALELVLGLSFLALPAFGVICAKLAHGPVIVRYFLPTLIGLCIVLGNLFGTGKTALLVRASLALVIALLLGDRFGRLVWHRYHGQGENLIEPISGRPMNTTSGHPLDRYGLLVSEAANSTVPIGVLTQWDFVYLIQYAPQLVPRLYFLTSSENSFFFRAFRELRPWFAVKYNVQLTTREFRRLAPDFLIYGLYRDDALNTLSTITQTGRAIKFLKVSDGHFLAEVVTQTTARPDPRNQNPANHDRRIYQHERPPSPAVY
ncbi:MAG: glycosyltransferase family 39 protein [Bryobacteraceae bacterium]